MKTLFVPVLLVLTSLAVTVNSAPISSGDLVIYRVGDGAAALANTATAVFLDEYTTAGSFVQSIALPTSGLSDLTAVGTATTEGVISRSQNGNSLVFTGYRKATGLANPSSDTYATTARVIGTLTAAGTADTSTSIINDNGSTTANTIRSATSVDGTSAFWVSTSTRVSYSGSGIGSSAGTTQIDARNSRQLNFSGNTLFAANGTTITPKVQSYGTLPTGATTPTAIVSLATGSAVNGFALFDLDAGVAGDDTLYALDTVANLLYKYTYDGSTWFASGSVAASSAQNLTGYVNGSTVNLFLTSSTALLAKTDSSGYNASITAGALTSLATAGANTGFRGIGMFPVVVPEPTLLSFGLVLAGVVAFRRRQS